MTLYLRSVLQVFLQYPLVTGYMLAGSLPILVKLLITGHAVLHPISPNGDCGCPDRRVSKELLVFGGAAAFTLGIPYFLLAWVTSSSFGGLLPVYGVAHLTLTVVQAVSFILQVLFRRRYSGRLKAHWDCGWIIAWSPLWPLYWLQQLTHAAWISKVRNVITIVDFIASLPITLAVFNPVTLLFKGKLTQPSITAVDFPTTQH